MQWYCCLVPTHVHDSGPKSRGAGRDTAVLCGCVCISSRLRDTKLTALGCVTCFYVGARFRGMPTTVAMSMVWHDACGATQTYFRAWTSQNLSEQRCSGFNTTAKYDCDIFPQALPKHETQLAGKGTLSRRCSLRKRPFFLPQTVGGAFTLKFR